MVESDILTSTSQDPSDDRFWNMCCLPALCGRVSEADTGMLCGLKREDLFGLDQGD